MCSILDSQLATGCLGGQACVASTALRTQIMIFVKMTRLHSLEFFFHRVASHWDEFSYLTPFLAEKSKTHGCETDSGVTTARSMRCACVHVRDRYTDCVT